MYTRTLFVLTYMAFNVALMMHQRVREKKSTVYGSSAERWFAAIRRRCIVMIPALAPASSTACLSVGGILGLGWFSTPSFVSCRPFVAYLVLLVCVVLEDTIMAWPK